MKFGAGTSGRHVSPLRYPGGKTRMVPALAALLAHQSSDLSVWVEPFAGGAGAGLGLLALGAVQEVHLGELDPPLAALWRTMIEAGDALADRVAHTAPDMRLWEECLGVLGARADGEVVPDFELGFAAFVVNRCSRSGMISHRAGPIGGKGQTGRWGVGARFNPEGLAGRIRLVHEWGLQGRLRVSERDAVETIISTPSEQTLLFVDPPYLVQGNRLYTKGMDADAHTRLAWALNTHPGLWLATYDDDRTVPQVLYPGRRVLAFQAHHSANRRRIDWELAVLSPDLSWPQGQGLMPDGDTRWVREHERSTLAA